MKKTEYLSIKPVAEQLSEEVLSLHAQFLNIIEQSVIATDLGGTVIYWNWFAEQLYGWSAKEAIGRNVKELITPKTSVGQTDEIIAELSQDKIWTGELIVQRKDGKTFPAQTTFSPIYDKQTLIGLISLSNDITERKQMEQALRVSEARYRSLLENANDVIYSHDLAGDIITLNDAAEKYTGYSSEELKKMNIVELVVPEHHERIKQVIERKLHDPTPSIHEFDIITKDGRRRTLEVNPKISAIEGQPLAIEGVARDITERKDTEERLRDSEERLRLATGAAKMYSWEIDFSTQEIKYSDNPGNMFNLDSLPKTFDKVIANVHPEDREQCLRVFERTKSETGTVTHQYRVFSSTGKPVWLELHAVTVRDERGKPVSLIGITQNITERKLAEEFRQTWAERLEAAREDERRRLSLQLHYDIVQQLAVASIKLQQLEKKLIELLPEENGVFSNLVLTQELLHRNQKSLRHMAHVLHSGVLEQFGLIEAFRKFKSDMETLLTEQTANLSLELPSHFPRLTPSVEIGIYRTVQEAAINALKHSRAKLISLRLAVRDDLALVVIEDNGCGFDTEKIESNGIGFASMYDRAKTIGAKLDIASQIGKGTIVTIEVPLEKR